MRRLTRGRWRSSIAARLFLWQGVAVVLVTIVAFALILIGSATDAEKAAAGRSMTAAKAIAHNPYIDSTIARPDPAVVLQPYAKDLVQDSDISFLTIFGADGDRYTHSTPDGIGSSFTGYERALRGESYSQSYVGPLGAAVRSVVPVRLADGEVVGVVVAAVDLDDVQSSLGSRILTLTLSAVAFLLIAGLGTWGLSRYLRRVTWGRGAEELSRMFEFYESVLHALDEGLLLLDERHRAVLANDRAARMLGLARIPSVDAPAALADLGVPEELRLLLEAGDRLEDEVIVTDELLLVVNQEPVTADTPGRPRTVGSVVTLRDRTRLQELSGELENNAVLTDALRAQTHEFGNRLHTIIALIELGRTAEAVELAGAEVGVAQRLADSMVEVADEPILTALLLGKSAQARERGVRFDVSVTGALDRTGIPTRDLITIVGNLVDNALDAVARADGARVAVAVDGRPDALVLTVSDSGTGPDAGALHDLFELGATTKRSDGRPRGVGLALVRQCVTRLGGAITVEGSAFRVELPVAAGVEAR
jgi:sensor histidine kinase regulating citrate/malate metabolism